MVVVNFPVALFGDERYMFPRTSSFTDYKNQFITLARRIPTLSDGVTHACVSTQTCLDMSITKSTFRDYFRFGEKYIFRTKFYYDTADVGEKTFGLPAGLMVHLQTSTFGSLLADSNTFTNMVVQRTTEGVTCNEDPNIKLNNLWNLPLKISIVDIKGNIDTVVSQNSFSDITLTSNIWHHREQDPKLDPNGSTILEKKLAVIGNSFSNMSSFNSAYRSLFDFYKIPFATDKSYIETSQETPCTHFIFDKNEFHTIADTYEANGMISLTCSGMEIVESYKDTNFAAVPEKNVTFTINSTLTGNTPMDLVYNLNQVTISNNVFNTIVVMRDGLIKVKQSPRVQILNNSITNAGFYSSELFRSVHPILANPAGG